MVDDQQENRGEIPSQPDIDPSLNIPLSDGIDQRPLITPGVETSMKIIEEVRPDEVMVRTYFARSDTASRQQVKEQIKDPLPSEEETRPSTPSDAQSFGAYSAVQAPDQPADLSGSETKLGFHSVEDTSPLPKKRRKKKRPSCLLMGFLTLLFIVVLIGGSYFAMQALDIEMVFIDTLIAQLTPQPNSDPTEQAQPSSMAATPTETGSLVEPTRTLSPTPAIGVTQISPGDGEGTETPESEDGDSEPDFVDVPGGTFVMGEGRFAHEVTLSPYAINRTEVTNAQWAECFSDDVCSLPVSTNDYTGAPYYGIEEFDNYPVIYVTWEQADTFCQWQGGRLPTEAEWEMAARWDPETEEVTLYPWGNEFEPANLNFCDESCLLDSYANPIYDDGWPQLAPVGSFPEGASPLGVLDMSGNVAEWVADWFSSAASGDTNPSGPDTGTTRVIRGGSWGVGNPSSLTSILRSSFAPSQYVSGLGFRCVVPADE